MKKTPIAIYNSSWGTFGGGEKYICTLAQELSLYEGLDVQLLVDIPGISKEHFQKYYNLDLKNVALEQISRSKVQSALRSADVAIVTTNFRSFGRLAKKNIYILQIPYRGFSWPGIIAKGLMESPREAAKDCLRLKLMKDARHADEVLVYSDFCKKTLAAHHHIQSEVLYPAIDDFDDGIPKQKVILSVGRFFQGLYNEKRFDVLIDAFRKFVARTTEGTWEYRLVGTCSADTSSQEYLKALKEQARGLPISFHVNAPFTDLRRHCNEAAIFWHAAGYGVDELRFPERMEHFGMTTVEAMSARCIPIVINKGGQKEIVQHGDSGFLWETPDELVEQTLHLVNDPSLGARLQDRARERSRDFSRESFSLKVRSIFGKVVPGVVPEIRTT